MADQGHPPGSGWMHYDRTVNLGHILTAATVACTVLAGVIYLRADVTQLQIELSRQRAEIASEVTAIRADAAGREARLRATELTQAGQSSDLRAMSASLTRIERLLEARTP
ncbi:hypothetical protein [Pararhodobacter zhoushanensis]|uniref:hypothetical protein n=1 Tax=Pararhodobacter zhoushanensis TaxID=2479545 RepID=UPI0013E0B9CF|nr:hypothetical protein [Pararhodobacter zhoushanensis]